MFSGILISVRDHPYSTSAKKVCDGGGQILMRAKSVKGKKGYLLQMLKSSDAKRSLKSEGKDDSDLLGFKESTSEYCK
jgi:hypothetical protein